MVRITDNDLKQESYLTIDKNRSLITINRGSLLIKKGRNIVSI